MKFVIPASFVLARVAVLTSAELAYGYRNGWLADDGVVALALARYEAGSVLSEAEEELALLLSDDLGRVPELVGALDGGETDGAGVWFFLALAWIDSHRSDWSDAVEILCADFGYPDDALPLLRFMPPTVDGQVGLKDYVARKAREYGERHPS